MIIDVFKKCISEVDMEESKKKTHKYILSGDFKDQAILLVSAITIAAVKFLKDADVKRIIMEIKHEIWIVNYEYDKNNESNYNFYYIILAILKIYISLESDNITGTNSDLGYIDLLIKDKCIDKRILNYNNLGIYIKLFRCWAEINEKDFFEYKREFELLTDDLINNQFNTIVGFAEMYM